MVRELIGLVPKTLVLFLVMFAVPLFANNQEAPSIFDSTNPLYGVYIFSHPWCGPSHSVFQLFNKISNMNFPSVPVYKINEEQLPLADFTVQWYKQQALPVILLARNSAEFIRYEYDLNIQQVGYWMLVYFNRTFPSAPDINSLLGDKKQHYQVSLPSAVDPLKDGILQWQFRHPLFHIYLNTSEQGRVLRLVSKPQNLLIVRDVPNTSIIHQALDFISSRIFYLPTFSHRLRQHLINTGMRAVALFYEPTQAYQPLHKRFLQSSLDIIKHFHYPNHSLSYQFGHNISNKTVFVECPASNSKCLKLLGFLGKNLRTTMPTVISFAFADGVLTHTEYKTHKYQMFPNRYMFWVEHSVALPDPADKKTTFCVRPKLIASFNPNTQQGLVLQILLERLSRKHVLLLQIDSMSYGVRMSLKVCKIQGTTQYKSYKELVADLDKIITPPLNEEDEL